MKLPTAKSGKGIRSNGTRLAEIRGKKGLKETRKFLKARVLSRVFSEDYERVRKKTLLDPRGQTIHRWNKIFLVACLVSLFVDPLFFYLPLVRDEVCIDIGTALEVFLTMIRSMADVFYMIQILMKFRTAYVAPSSRVFGRGELVIDTTKIATRYLRKGFGLDFIAALPLPQVNYYTFPLSWSKPRCFFDLVGKIVTGVNLDCDPQSRRFNHGKHKECASLYHHFPIFTKAVSDFSTFIPNCKSYRGCDRNSMGWGCLQLGSVHVG